MTHSPRPSSEKTAIDPVSRTAPLVLSPLVYTSSSPSPPTRSPLPYLQSLSESPSYPLILQQEQQQQWQRQQPQQQQQQKQQQQIQRHKTATHSPESHASEEPQCTITPHEPLANVDNVSQETACQRGNSDQHRGDDSGNRGLGKKHSIIAVSGAAAAVVLVGATIGGIGYSVYSRNKRTKHTLARKAARERIAVPTDYVSMHRASDSLHVQSVAAMDDILMRWRRSSLPSLPLPPSSSRVISELRTVLVEDGALLNDSVFFGQWIDRSIKSIEASVRRRLYLQTTAVFDYPDAIPPWMVKNTNSLQPSVSDDSLVTSEIAIAMVVTATPLTNGYHDLNTNANAHINANNARTWSSTILCCGGVKAIERSVLATLHGGCALIAVLAPVPRAIC